MGMLAAGEGAAPGVAPNQAPVPLPFGFAGSDVAGFGAAVIPAAGATFVRFVRAPGTTVTGATSASRMMTALPLGPARGYYPGDL